MAALLLLTLTGCGGSKAETTPDVDLEKFYEDLAREYGWDENYRVDLEGEMLEGAYPGLDDIEEEQLIVKAPMMSAVVNEIVLMQCDTEEGADQAEQILQERISYQVGDETNPGGAWYPESIEAWKKAEVLRHGVYVALIASAEHQSEIVKRFEQNFQ